MDASTGHLGLPLSEVFLFNPLSTNEMHIWYEKYRSTDAGKEISKMIEDDSRTQALIGKNVLFSGTYNEFSISSLVNWYLWRLNSCGEDTARRELDRYLDATLIPCWASVWVTGIETQTAIELFDGYTVTPFSKMPEAFDKYLMHNPVPIFPFSTPQSHTAIIKVVEVPKTGDENGQLCTPLWEEIRKIYRIVELLNLIHGSRPTVHSAVPYLPDNIPNGFFSNLSCSSYPNEVSSLLPEAFQLDENVGSVKELENLYTQYSSKNKRRGEEF